MAAAPAFLKGILRTPTHPWTLIDDNTGACLASRVKMAADSESRRRGLLGKSGLDDEALIIAPCSAVHTFFMKFAIDVIFVDRDGVVTRIFGNVRPWRLAATLRGFAAIEVSAGTAARTGTRVGHQIALVA